MKDPAENGALETLQGLVGVFTTKGWLNQTLRIKRRDRRYRICCNEREFLAYRINDRCDVPPGLSVWPVCIVTRDHIVEDSDMSAFASTEPSAHDWLRTIADGEFELI